MSFAYGTFNMLKKNTFTEVVADLNKVLPLVDVIGLQENTRHATHRAIGWLEDRPDWEVYAPHAAQSDPIAWRPDIFEALPGHGFERTHGGEAGVTPARYVVWQPLRHKASGKTVMVLNTHVINGYAGQDKAPRALRDRDAEAHWRKVVDITWRFMEAYDAVLLAGDFNVRLGNTDEPWYPGVLLKSLYDFDHASGIDHVLATGNSDVKVLAHRTVKGLHSDHDAHYSLFEFTDEEPPAPEPVEEEPVPTGFMPGVIVKNIPPGSNDPKILPCGVICHVAVSRSDSLHSYFDGPSGGIESHFYVRSDGTIEQYRSIFYEADANSGGNSFYRGGARFGFVSIETEGMGEGEWTRAQLDSIKRIIGFVHSQSKFALRKCPGPREAGVGYHALFRDWNPNAHSCPGPDRIRQFNTIIVPWLEAGADTKDWFDMASKRDLQDAIRDTRISIKRGDKTQEKRLEAVLRELEEEQDRQAQTLAKIVALLDPDRFSDLVASKINVDVQADADVVKEAVKQALVEGVNG